MSGAEKRFVPLCVSGKFCLFGCLVILVLLGNLAECDPVEDTEVPAILLVDEEPPAVPSDNELPEEDATPKQLIHPRLSELLGTTMPHQFDKIFMDKQLPIEALLSLPVASIPCGDAQKVSAIRITHCNPDPTSLTETLAQRPTKTRPLLSLA